MSDSVTERRAPAGGDKRRGTGKEEPEPIAELISLPFQYNQDYGIGPNDATCTMLNSCPRILPARRKTPGGGQAGKVNFMFAKKQNIWHINRINGG